MLKIEDYEIIKIKNSREYIKYRALSVVALRALCDMTRNEIGRILGSITQATVTSLARKGIEELKENKGLFNEIVALV